MDKTIPSPSPGQNPKYDTGGTARRREEKPDSGGVRQANVRVFVNSCPQTPDLPPVTRGSLPVTINSAIVALMAQRSHCTMPPSFGPNFITIIIAGGFLSCCPRNADRRPSPPSLVSAPPPLHCPEVIN